MSEYSTPSRAQQLWGHLAGLFGADALKRKYGPTPPMEWTVALEELTEPQLKQGIKNLLGAGRGSIPSLPEFLHACRSAREWSAPPSAGAISDQQFDKWDEAGGRHLLAHILREAAKHRHYHEHETRILVKWMHTWSQMMREEDHGEGVGVDDQKTAWSYVMGMAVSEGVTSYMPNRP